MGLGYWHVAGLLDLPKEGLAMNRRSLLKMIAGLPALALIKPKAPLDQVEDAEWVTGESATYGGYSWEFKDIPVNATITGVTVTTSSMVYTRIAAQSINDVIDKDLGL